MLKSLIIGIGFIVALAVAWAVVQALWRNAFREEYSDEDVLAGRRSCANCGCTTLCEQKKKGRVTSGKVVEIKKIEYKA